MVHISPSFISMTTGNMIKIVLCNFNLLVIRVLEIETIFMIEILLPTWAVKG